MLGLFKKSPKEDSSIEWNQLNSIDQLQTIKLESVENPVIIFKHSTRCSISHAVFSRFERSWNADEMKDVKLYYLDLITYREVSNEVAQRFGVQHESPQIIVIKEGVTLYDNSHYGIEYNEIKAVLNNS